ncbi:MAG TPA: hypothetical protein DEA44_16755, partial [Firmicutes bacterium]|nr:hypothetical protein [Bacillota bacterium]
MQTKYSIDRDTRTLILKYIRKYDEYKRWYKAEKERAYQLRPPVYGEAIQTSAPADPVLAAAEALERLENSHRARVVQAIESARKRIGGTYEDAEARRRLVNAIWLSCLE